MELVIAIKVGIAVYFAVRAWEFVAFMAGGYAQAWRDWRNPPKPPRVRKYVTDDDLRAEFRALQGD